jgi:hypothetical protein
MRFDLNKRNVAEYQIQQPDKFLKTKFKDLFTDTIKDVIEIYFPVLAVVVASHDAKIRILRLEDKS